MLNWDWLHNRPAAPAPGADASQPGWWANLRQLVRPPLLDPDLPEEQLAGWIDKHTMAVHHVLLPRLALLRRDAATQALVLDDPYWEQLQALPPWQP